jgi:hypothetical protein
MGEVASGHQATQQPKNLLGAVKTRDGERMTTATCHATLSHVALPQDGHLRMRCRSAHANGGMRLHHAGKCSVPESNVTEAPAASCSSCLCSQRGSAPWENQSSSSASMSRRQNCEGARPHRRKREDASSRKGRGVVPSERAAGGNSGARGVPWGCRERLTWLTAPPGLTPQLTPAARTAHSFLQRALYRKR